MSLDPTSRCPVCTEPNGCENGPGDRACWCFGRSVSSGLRGLLDERGGDDRCLCPRCAVGDVPSPCVDLCTMDQASGACLGCGRTLGEIVRWSTLGPVGRAVVHLRIREQ